MSTGVLLILLWLACNVGFVIVAFAGYRCEQWVRSRRGERRIVDGDRWI